MENYGFIRVGAAVPKIEVANCRYNIDSIYELIVKAEQDKVAVLTFPELCVSGYTCADLFFQSTLIEECEKSIAVLLEKTKDIDMLITIGAPVKAGYKLYNCAIVIYKGKILCIIPKTFIPNYEEFYEKRWFSSDELYKTEIKYCGQETFISSNVLIQHENIKELCIGVEICEDLWSPISPSAMQALAGANLILNLSASNDYVGKAKDREKLIQAQSNKCICAYVYTSAGFGESTTDLAFGGNVFIYEKGDLIASNKEYSIENKLVVADIDLEKISVSRQKNGTFADNQLRFANDYEKVYFNTSKSIEGENIYRTIEKSPFAPTDIAVINEKCYDIFNIQVFALAKRVLHAKSKSLVIAVSGGLDSTLALLVCAKTCDLLGFDRKMITAITMPGFGTSGRTYKNAVDLINNVGATFREISIREAVIQHFKDIGHDINNHDVTYENSQARERTKILMDVANQENGLVIGTGDLSELALGWATYNGDHMSMYGVNTSVPKTLLKPYIKYLADNVFNEGVKETLYDIIDTPVSPELLPPDAEGKISQKTEELVGPYELHDFFLYNMLKFGYRPSKIFFLAKIAFKGVYDSETIYKWLKNFYSRFFSQQFKRSCMPDGPKVGSVSLSPRGDFRMPSDASVKIWMEDLEGIGI